MSRKKVAIAVCIVAGYFLVSFLIFVSSCLMVARNVKALEFTQASKYAQIARGSGYPFFLANRVLKQPDLIVIEDGLLSIQTIPGFIHNSQLIADSYTKREPLTVFMLEPWRLQLEQTIERVTRFSELNSKSIFVQQYVSNEYAQYLSQFSNELKLFFLITDTVIERFNESRNYKILFLFQNNHELRATGGFPGSYGVLTLSPGVPPTFEIQDIYVPDGQLTEHVDPPLPIQEAFQQGFWKLRDANWHPDFPSSAENILWFFEKGTGETFDAVIAVNFSFIESILNVTGPIYLPDKQVEVDNTNVYSILQRTDDQEFFAGSTEKKDILSAFATQLQYAIFELEVQKKIELLSLFQKSLSTKNIQLHFQDMPLQTFASTQEWTGTLRPHSYAQESMHYISINESNLGVNKANCCIKRKTELLHTQLPEKLTSILHLTYTNDSIVDEKYRSVTGRYKAYVRIYVDHTTNISPPIVEGKTYTTYIQELKNSGQLHPEVSEGFSLESVFGLTELGFWIVAEQGKELHVTINTESSGPEHGSLFVSKQAGVTPQADNWIVVKNNQILYSGSLEENQIIQY